MCSCSDPPLDLQGCSFIFLDIYGVDKRLIPSHMFPVGLNLVTGFASVILFTLFFAPSVIVPPFLLLSLSFLSHPSPPCHLLAYRETGHRCPVDKTKLTPQHLFKDNFAKREVLSLNVHCSADDHGCAWQGELRDLKVRSTKVVVVCLQPKLPQICNYIALGYL